MPVLNVNALIDQRVSAIRQYHQLVGIGRAELDLSGGIDSAVMAGLLTLALGTEKLTMVYSSINSGSETQARAETLATALGARLIVHDLTATYEAMIADMVNNLESAGFDRQAIEARIKADNTILGSIRSCIRAPLGRGYLRMTGNGLRHGTGNECEDRWLRFYQKGGDGEVDTNPIAMLSKGEVYQLATGLGHRLNAPEAYRSIIDAAPTPELWGSAISHTDEDEIGAHLGLADSGHTFYSYVNTQDGSYRTVGLVERVARFADTPAGGELFSDTLDEPGMNTLIAQAQKAPTFSDVAPDTVATMLRAARRTERATRHKENPNCPSLGRRADLLSLGILTDTLPRL